MGTFVKAALKCRYLRLFTRALGAIYANFKKILFCIDRDKIDAHEGSCDVIIMQRLYQWCHLITIVAQNLTSLFTYQLNWLEDKLIWIIPQFQTMTTRICGVVNTFVTHMYVHLYILKSIYKFCVWFKLINIIMWRKFVNFCAPTIQL